MGIVTISLKKSDEDRLRKLAFERFGKTKGALSRMISESLKKIEHQGTEADDVLLEIARKGLHFEKANIKKMREEMYGRYKGLRH